MILLDAGPCSPDCVRWDAVSGREPGRRRPAGVAEKAKPPVNYWLVKLTHAIVRAVEITSSRPP
jgi:hypothetical protein